MMKRPLRTTALSFALLNAVALTACNDTKPAIGDALAQDTTLDLLMAKTMGDTAAAVAGDTPSLAPAAAAAELSTAPVSTRSPAVAATENDRNELSGERAPSPNTGGVNSSRSREVGTVPLEPSETRSNRASSPGRRSAVTRSTAVTRRTSASRRSLSRRATAARTPASARRIGNVRLANTRISRNSSLPAGPLRGYATLPTGFELQLTALERVCMNTQEVTHFTAVVPADVMGPIGVVLPQGSTVAGELTRGKNADSKPDLRLTSVSVHERAYPLQADVTDVELQSVRTRSRIGRSAAAGTAAGAVLGQVIGRNTRATVFGAAAGAATGAAIGSRTRTTGQCIPARGRITARLIDPLAVAVSN